MAFNSELSERAESIYIFARSAWLSFRIDYISLIVNYTIFNLRKIHITLGSLWAMWGKYKGSAFKLVCFALACIIFFDSYVMMTSPSHIYRFYYSPLETTHVINVATVLVRYIYRLVGPNKLINLGGWTVRSIRSISLALVHLLHLTNCLKVLLPWGTHAWSCTCHMRVVLLLLPQMEKKHPGKQQSWRQLRISKNAILYMYNCF